MWQVDSIKHVIVACAHEHLHLVGACGQLINRPRNSLVCSPSLSQDLRKQDVKYRICYLHDDDSGGIFL